MASGGSNAASFTAFFRPWPRRDAGAESNQQSAVVDVEAMGAQIEALLRTAGHRLRKQLDHRGSGHESAHDGVPQLVPSGQYGCATEKSSA